MNEIQIPSRLNLTPRFRYYGTFRKRENFVCFKALRHRKRFHNTTPGTERKVCIKIFLCCQGHALCSLWRR